MRDIKLLIIGLAKKVKSFEKDVRGVKIQQMSIIRQSRAGGSNIQLSASFNQPNNQNQLAPL